MEAVLRQCNTVLEWDLSPPKKNKGSSLFNHNNKRWHGPYFTSELTACLSISYYVCEIAVYIYRCVVSVYIVYSMCVYVTEDRDDVKTVELSTELPGHKSPTVNVTIISDSLVHGQVTIIFVVSVCLSVCLCRVFLSRL